MGVGGWGGFVFGGFLVPGGCGLSVGRGRGGEIWMGWGDVECGICRMWRGWVHGVALGVYGFAVG